MQRWVWVGIVVAVCVLRLAGAFTVGSVTSGSMDPTLPTGSVFLGVRANVDAGDIVVYRAPDGARVVHRAVEPEGDGWVTRGDANAATDQENGLPPSHPYAVVPVVNGAPLAFRLEWLKPILLVGAETALLTFGLKGVLEERRAAGRPLPLLPHHLALGAAVITLVAAPFLLHQDLTANGALTVSATLVPTLVRVQDATGVSFHELPPFATTTVAAQGPVDIVRAPDLPGARALAGHGVLFAVLPTVFLFVALAGGLRWAGC